MSGEAGEHMKLRGKNSEMPRLFVVFRTFDRVWDSRMYTREHSPLDMDTSHGNIHFNFQRDYVAGSPTSTVSTTTGTEENELHNDNMFYLKPHRGHAPVFFGQKSVSLLNGKSYCCQPISIFPCSEKSQTIENNFLSDSEKRSDFVLYFVLPKKRCTVVVDAHVAACMSIEYHRSRTFRRRLCHKIIKSSGFRHCLPEYEKWTQKERDAWDNYLSIPFMLDVIAVWPWQKVDYAWSDRILNLLNKHVTLEESLAWLSTLGGAHSSLGETFIDHAERAGEISLQQMKLARELGNEIMIARCYLYWAWSLLQRDYLANCKICILNTWKYVKKIKCTDTILTNMCRAIWSRLQYQRSVVYKTKVRCYPSSRDHGYRDTDDSGCGGVQRKGNKDSHYNESVEAAQTRMQPVQVC